MTGTVPCDGGLTDIAHRGTLLYTDAMEHLGIPHAHGCVGAKHTENSADCYQATKKIKVCSACGPFLLLVLAGVMQMRPVEAGTTLCGKVQICF